MDYFWAGMLLGIVVGYILSATREAYEHVTAAVKPSIAVIERYQDGDNRYIFTDMHTEKFIITGTNQECIEKIRSNYAEDQEVRIIFVDVVGDES